MDLAGKVGVMIGIQAIVAVLATVHAASYLKARDRHPNWLDPTRGYRPPCGDDPIFWREYELPMRRGGGSVLALRLRTVRVLILAILINALALVAIALVLAMPIGLLFATIYYGVPAFQEYWRLGAAGPFTERTRFNLVVRVATGIFALVPAMSLGTVISGKITAERDKKTWDALLTTPLSGEEILRSKAKAALHGFWQSAWPVPIVWVLGLACGVVMPLPLLLVAIDVPLFAWLSLALGFFGSLKPQPAGPASSRLSMLTMLMFLIQIAVMGASLVAPWEYAVFSGWDWRIRWGVVLGVLAVVAATGLIAWRLTRRVLSDFEEWVGRPRVDPAAGPGGTVASTSDHVSA